MKNLREKKQPNRTTSTKAERRRRLERATVAYLRSLSGKVLEEEKRLEAAVAEAASNVDFDE